MTEAGQRQERGKGGEENKKREREPTADEGRERGRKMGG